MIICTLILGASHSGFFFFVVGDAPSATPNTKHSPCVGDNSASFPGATCVSSRGAMQMSLLIENDESMPLKCPKIPGTLNNYFLYCNMHLLIHKKLWIEYPMTFFARNDTFYKKLYDLTLQIFKPTIHTRWNIISELILPHYFFLKSLIGATFFLSFGSFLLLALSNNFMFCLKRWNLQEKKLKDQLIKDLKHEFGTNIFDDKKF